MISLIYEFNRDIFEALGSIPTFDVLLFANLPIGSICYFKLHLSVALSPSKTFFPWPGALIAQFIIITYEDYIKVIKYTAKEQIYCLAQQLMSYHTVEVTDTSIPDSKNLK